MSSINVVSKIYTHGGSVAKKISPEQQLRRSVLSCLLWEKEYYEDGKTIVDRIRETASFCSPKFVYDLAYEARHIHGLRHVPLLLLLDLVSRKIPIITPGFSVKHAIRDVIRRPDEMTELVALYWHFKTGGKPFNKIPVKMSDRQLRDGLALCFHKFNEYSLAKYNRDGAVRLRDVMFLSHPKPRNEEEAQVFKRLANNELETPDTWEVELSAGKDKKVTFERLIKEGKLGYLALLRNLRNMSNANCDEDLVKRAILERKGADLVLPFRYVGAARAAPSFESELDIALQETIKKQEPLKGRTVVLVDVSGSMETSLSAKSDLSRMDAACTLASVINCENLRVFSFSSQTVEVPARRGMAGVDAIKNSQRHGSTNMANAINKINHEINHDRLIVITDEQATNRYEKIPSPVVDRAYMINVASNRNGVGYGPWIHLDGFSEGVIRYVHEIEKLFEEGK